MADWEGQAKPWGDVRIPSDRVREKVLQIGIPDGSMTEEQLRVFEKVGKMAQELGVKVKVTPIQ